MIWENNFEDYTVHRRKRGKVLAGNYEDTEFFDAKANAHEEIKSRDFK